MTLSALREKSYKQRVYNLSQKPPSLLENSFAASFEPCSGAESPAYWRFALGSGPPLGLAVAFSTGCSLSETCY